MTIPIKDIVSMAANLNALLTKMTPGLAVDEKLRIDITRITDQHSKEVITRLTEYLVYIGKQLEAHEDLQSTLVTQKEMEALLESLQLLNVESQQALQTTKLIASENRVLKAENEEYLKIYRKQQAMNTQLLIQQQVAKTAFASIMLRASQTDDAEFLTPVIADIVTMIDEAQKLIKPIV